MTFQAHPNSGGLQNFKKRKEKKKEAKYCCVRSLQNNSWRVASRPVKSAAGLAGVVQAGSPILSERRCNVPSVDLSPMSDPVCPVNLFHFLPQCAAEVIYMVGNIN